MVDHRRRHRSAPPATTAPSPSSCASWASGPRASTGPWSSCAGPARPLEPNGKPLFAGAQSQPWPGDALGDFFNAGDQLREFRGDAHTAAWTAAGLDGPEIGIVSERFSGIPPRTYVRTRAWGTDRLDAAESAS